VVDEDHRYPLTEVVGGVEEPQPVISGEFPSHTEVAAETALERSLDPF
jgi:hypothetical protein